MAGVKAPGSRFDAAGLLAYNTRRLRTEMGLSQHELSEKAGLSINMVGEIERGNGNSRQTTVSQLCRALGVSVDKLYAPPPGPDGAEGDLKSNLLEAYTLLGDALRLVDKAGAEMAAESGPEFGKKRR